jgi:diguanylate cyclase (GGDEF)-like protein
MTEPSRSRGDEDVQRALARTERGMGAIQEMIAVLRDGDREIAGLLERLRHMELLVWSDVLTGLLNQRGLEEELAREEARSRRYSVPAAVVVLEIIDLALIVDQHGEASKDLILRAAGAAIRSGARGSDVVARYSDEAFAAVLPGADTRGAGIFVSRVATAVPYVRLPDGDIVPVHLATAMATREESGSLQAAYELARQRLLLSRATARGAPASKDDSDGAASP